MRACTAPFHDRPDAEHSAKFAIAMVSLSLIRKCWATRTIFKIATRSTR